MYESYPLQWPTAYKVTPQHNRIYSRFDQSMDKAQQFLRKELDRLGARDLVISTNLRVRTDGGLYAADLSKKIDEPGVAIYFKYNGKPVTMCCDQYLRVWENIYALGKGIEALRGMERWGVSEFMERAFTGFTALPESTAAKTCWDILDMAPSRDEDLIKKIYRQKLFKAHPDHGGSSEKVIELNTAYEQALQYAAE